MITREVLEEEKQNYNKLVNHPLQSWEWGEFRKKTGVKVVRLGVFDNKKLISAYQVTVHPIPRIPFTIIYLPRGPMPDKPMIEALMTLGKKEKAILVKLEPQVGGPKENRQTNGKTVQDFLLSNGARLGKPLFTKYTFQLNLKKTEEELSSQMKEKTRYNVRLAQKKGVQVKEDNSPQAFENYLKLTQETTKRQKFYAHTEKYHRLMWETLKPSGVAHLLVASYQGKPLTTWYMFIFNKVLYYPYGASSSENREVMASNLMMWEAIRFGKKMGCETFDLWGALGPDPNPKDPWYGFHRFKEGYGGKLIEFIGTYDLVVNPYLYHLYRLSDFLRWKLLRFKSLSPFNS